MEQKFHVDSRLSRDSAASLELGFSKLLLFNNANFPWVILIPKKHNLREITDLIEQEQIMLLKEINQVSNVMQKIFSPDKMNIAALGNMVEQLHIHIIARYKNDLAWPNPAFGYEKKEYKEEEALVIIKKLQEYIEC